MVPVELRLVALVLFEMNFPCPSGTGAAAAGSGSGPGSTWAVLAIQPPLAALLRFSA